MDVTDVAITGVLGTLVVLIGVELFAPARTFEDVRGWRIKCMAFVVLILAIAGSIPFALAELIDDVKVVPGERLGIVGGTIVGIFVSELIIYWAHRLHHAVPFLWRWVHQLHHSAERVDVFGAAYFHPFEILEGTIVGVVLFNVVLGLAPEAAVLAGAWQPFTALFQHGNFKTPVWLGYLIQRPEAHGVHHERGIHGFNYANLPLWDLVFGTFKNPRAWQGLAGFYPGASQQTWQMLIGRDVSRDPSRTNADRVRL